jgi:hypothetical protein
MNEVFFYISNTWDVNQQNLSNTASFLSNGQIASNNVIPSGKLT